MDYSFFCNAYCKQLGAIENVCINCQTVIYYLLALLFVMDFDAGLATKIKVLLDMKIQCDDNLYNIEARFSEWVYS